MTLGEEMDSIFNAIQGKPKGLMSKDSWCTQTLLPVFERSLSMHEFIRFRSEHSTVLCNMGAMNLYRKHNESGIKAGLAGHWDDVFRFDRPVPPDFHYFFIS